MGAVIGLTGGIGSGKSSVAAMLRELGATVIDADLLAREAVAPGSPALQAIVARFGPEALTPSGELDRRALGRRVFADEEARRALNAIVHPEVAALAAQQMSDALASGAPLVVYDVPLLYENGLEQSLPEVVVVWARPETQRSRIARRDQLSPEEIEARLAAQLPLADKAARADRVIDNDGDLEATRAQVRALYGALTEGEG